MNRWDRPRKFALSAAIGLRDDFDGGGLRTPAKATAHAAQGRRLFALTEIFDGEAQADQAAEQSELVRQLAAYGIYCPPLTSII